MVSQCHEEPLDPVEFPVEPPVEPLDPVEPPVEPLVESVSSSSRGSVNAVSSNAVSGVVKPVNVADDEVVNVSVDEVVKPVNVADDEVVDDDGVSHPKH